MGSKRNHDYLNWSNTLPAFIPALFNFKKSDTPFSIITVLRREYASMLAAVIGFSFVEVLRSYIINGSLMISDLTLSILLGVSVVVIILRSLKHYTHLLNEKGRS